jgi:hypothetical protein
MMRIGLLGQVCAWTGIAIALATATVSMTAKAAVFRCVIFLPLIRPVALCRPPPGSRDRLPQYVEKEVGAQSRLRTLD